jgi:protein-S-isoprenylcysteine O-methyltransferase Ste14
MAPRADTAGVVFPPPLLFLLGFLLGVVLDNTLNLQRLPRPPTVLLLGALLLLLQAVVGFSAFFAMRKAKTQVSPYKPSSALVTSGVFGWSRNPMYLSMTLLYIALALLLGILGPLLVLPVLLAILRFGVVAREEAYLRQKFGDVYVSYSGAVRRWF